VMLKGVASGCALTLAVALIGAYFLVRSGLIPASHGSGKQAASPSPIAKGLYQKPPQKASEGVEDDPEGVSFWKIKQGIRLTGMPSFASPSATSKFGHGQAAARGQADLGAGPQLAGDASE
jgi:hypothetical protein